MEIPNQRTIETTTTTDSIPMQQMNTTSFVAVCFKRFENYKSLRMDERLCDGNEKCCL